jgi:hypothetical protein
MAIMDHKEVKTSLPGFNAANSFEIQTSQYEIHGFFDYYSIRVTAAMPDCIRNCPSVCRACELYGRACGWAETCYARGCC